MFTIPVVASLAEMASMSPSADGQYQWVSEFAPPNMQKFLSYISGWLAALGWQAFIASSWLPGWLTHSHHGVDTEPVVRTDRLVGHLGYSSDFAGINNIADTSRQSTLMTMAVGVFAIVFNSFGAKHLPLFEGLILVAFVIGFFGVCIPLWVLAPKASVSDVFGNFENFGGWASIGAACIVGQMAASAAFIVRDPEIALTSASADCIKRASIALST